LLFRHLHDIFPHAPGALLDDTFIEGHGLLVRTRRSSDSGKGSEQDDGCMQARKVSNSEGLEYKRNIFFELVAMRGRSATYEWILCETALALDALSHRWFSSVRPLPQRHPHQTKPSNTLVTTNHTLSESLLPHPPTSSLQDYIWCSSRKTPIFVQVRYQ
jgi:hypothetical protein